MKADNTSNTDEGSRQAGKSMIARGEHVSSSLWRDRSVALVG